MKRKRRSAVVVEDTATVRLVLDEWRAVRWPRYVKRWLAGRIGHPPFCVVYGEADACMDLVRPFVGNDGYLTPAGVWDRERNEIIEPGT
jgi:hypothetical protein